MNCPYCGKPMQKGYLQSGRGFIWSYEKKEDIYIASEETDIEFRSNIWKGCCVESWLCPDCNRLITEVNIEQGK